MSVSMRIDLKLSPSFEGLLFWEGEEIKEEEGRVARTGGGGIGEGLHHEFWCMNDATI